MNAELFGNGAKEIVELKKMVNYLNKNKNAYREWQRDAMSFMTQVLYAIDMGWQRFLTKVQNNLINISLLDFESIQNDRKSGSGGGAGSRGSNKFIKVKK
eukprot:5199974-Ditylum_brightwellii.AAC.1